MKQNFFFLSSGVTARVSVFFLLPPRSQPEQLLQLPAAVSNHSLASSVVTLVQGRAASLLLFHLFLLFSANNTEKLEGNIASDWKHV